jgi:hypothetical protein
MLPTFRPKGSVAAAAPALVADGGQLVGKGINRKGDPRRCEDS